MMVGSVGILFVLKLTLISIYAFSYNQISFIVLSFARMRPEECWGVFDANFQVRKKTTNGIFLSYLRIIRFSVSSNARGRLQMASVYYIVQQMQSWKELSSFHGSWKFHSLISTLSCNNFTVFGTVRSIMQKRSWIFIQTAHPIFSSHFMLCAFHNCAGWLS